MPEVDLGQRPVSGSAARLAGGGRGYAKMHAREARRPHYRALLNKTGQAFTESSPLDGSPRQPVAPYSVATRTAGGHRGPVGTAFEPSVDAEWWAGHLRARSHPRRSVGLGRPHGLHVVAGH